MFRQLMSSPILWESLSIILPLIILAITIRILIDKIMPGRKKEQKRRHEQTIEKDSNIKGREFEEHVGELLERTGWEIDYNGINKGKKDGGIDLIGKKGNETSLIQCKYRGNTNHIHYENEINQLYGALQAYRHDHPNERSKASFITTGQFSTEAKRIAKIHKIELLDKATTNLNFKPSI